MKKNQISVALNVVLIAVIAFLSFKLLTKKNTTTVSTVFKSCDSCKSDDFYGETVADIVQNVARYRGTHFEKIIHADDWRRIHDLSDNTGSSAAKEKDLLDARACWFALDTLKKFICLIEKYSSENKKEFRLQSSDLGIRFYYAVYPSNLPRDPKYSNHHTLIMVPTFNGGGGVNIDFDPRFNYDSSSNPKTKPLAYIYQNYDTMRTFQLDAGPSSQPSLTGGMYKNQGQLCPPYCPTIATAPNAMELADAYYPGGTGYGTNQPRLH